MDIIVGKNAGFCYGVKNAVDKSVEELKNNNKLCCLGEIVHNQEVVNTLESMGMVFIDELKENLYYYKTVIRAHGVSKQTYDYADENNIELLDLTCPNVLKIHRIAEEYKEKNYYIFVIGNKKHPETIGTVGFCGEKYYVIEDYTDIEDAVDSFLETNSTNILVIVQTTFSIEKFNDICKRLQNREELSNFEIEIKNTICNSTKVRQEETDELSKNVDFMIVIGGKKSSNTKKLYEVAVKNCLNTICVENLEDLKANLDFCSKINDKSKIGIMAGASTPQLSIDEIYNFLQK